MRIFKIAVPLGLAASWLALASGCKCNAWKDGAEMDKVIEVRTDVAPLAKSLNLVAPVVAARWALWPRDMPGLLPGRGGWMLYAWVEITQTASETLLQSASRHTTSIHLPRKIAQVLLPPGIAEPLDRADALLDRSTGVMVRGNAVDDEPTMRLLFVDGQPKGGVLRLGHHLLLSYCSFCTQ